MPTGLINIAGQSEGDQRLWNTYLFWARGTLDPTTRKNRSLDISKARQRIPASTATSLQIILFVAFALEYRLKRIYEVLDLGSRKRDGLGTLIQNFRRRLEVTPRLDDAGLIRLPPEWTRVQKRLEELNRLRNALVHGKYDEVLKSIAVEPRKMRQVARASYNALVDVIRITNQAIGYDTGKQRKTRAYYKQLKVPSK